jgi:hypothetical protein
MRPLRVILAAAVAFVAWRVFSGRAREALQRALALGDGHVPRFSYEPPQADGVGTHSSAAAAANHDFWDDRDVTVGEKLSPIGMQPGAH